MRITALTLVMIAILTVAPRMVASQQDPIAAGYTKQDLKVIDAWDVDLSTRDARRAAIQAIDRGDFRFVGTITMMHPPLTPRGLNCRVYGFPDDIYIEAYFITDVVGNPDQNGRSEMALNYAKLYNETIVASNGYIDSDICFSGHLTDGPKMDDGTLTSAVRLQKIDLVRERLIAGQSPHDENRWGITALSWALELGEQRIASVLVSYSIDE